SSAACSLYLPSFPTRRSSDLVVFHIVLFQVQHVQLGSAGLDGLFFQAVQLGALAHVAGNGDDFAVVVVFLQPGDDDGGIQTAGVSQYYFLDVRFVLFHDVPSPVMPAPGTWLLAVAEYLFIRYCILYNFLYKKQVENRTKDFPRSTRF